MGLMAIVIGLSMAGQAGTPDDVVRCGLEATSAEERAALADTMVGDDAASPLVEEIALRLRDCAIRAGYDATSGPQAVGVGIALLAAAEIDQRLIAAGIDTVQVAGWFADQDEDFRTRVPDDAAGERIVNGLNARGIPLEPLVAHAELVGGYIGVLIVVERARLGLPFE